MKLFSRRVHMMGPPAETMAYATDMCAFVNDKVGREIALWGAVFGVPLGSMMYTMRIEGVADLAAATGSLLADPEYHAKIAAGAAFAGAVPPEDSVGTPIRGELGAAAPPVGTYAAVTTAQIANGKYAEAFGWAVEVAEHVESTTGMPTMVMSSQYGPFGTVNWIAGGADAAAVDAANAALMGDEGYMKMLSAAGDLFLPGSGQQVLIQRLA
jgi:hypothetical protein